MSKLKIGHVAAHLLAAGAVGASMYALDGLHWSAPWAALLGWLVGIGQSILVARMAVRRGGYWPAVDEAAPRAAALDLVDLLRLLDGSIRIYPDRAHEPNQAAVCAVAFEAAAMGLVRVVPRDDGWVCERGQGR